MEQRETIQYSKEKSLEVVRMKPAYNRLLLLSKECSVRYRGLSLELYLLKLLTKQHKIT